MRLSTAVAGEVLAQSVEDVPTGSRPAGGGVKQTGLEMTLRGAVFERDGAFVIAPIVEAMRAARRIEILFMVPPIAGFRGLASYKSGGLSVRLMQAGNPYRYSVERASADTPVPELPLYEPAPMRAQHRQQQGGTQARPLVWVVVIALGVGAATFVVVLRRGSRL